MPTVRERVPLHPKSAFCATLADLIAAVGMVLGVIGYIVLFLGHAGSGRSGTGPVDAILWQTARANPHLRGNIPASEFQTSTSALRAARDTLDN